jgi:phosphohistidine phosphatase
MIVLVHHADAVDPVVDAQRPLSHTGRDHAIRLAGTLAERGLKPAVVWHSGKLRARQTAEAVLRACNPMAEFAAIRGLQPTDPPDWIKDRLDGETRTVVIAGHMPNLPRLAQLMVSGTRDGAFDFPPHGAVAFEKAGLWIELWREG